MFPYHQFSSSAGNPPDGSCGCGKMLPIDTWMASAPSCSIHWHTWIDSSSVFPFFSHGNSALLLSTALIFACRWNSGPSSLRMARMTSRRKRARFRSEPPYSSVRSLIAELRNCVNRYPCAEWSSTPSAPAARARRAPLTKYLHQIPDLRRRRRLAQQAVERVLVAGRRQAAVHQVLDTGHVTLAARVTELDDEPAIVGVDVPHDFTPERDLVVVIDHRVVRQDAPAHVHRYKRRDDRPDAAARELLFPVDARESCRSRRSCRSVRKCWIERCGSLPPEFGTSTG